MSIFRLRNGDLQLGDWKSRIDLKSTLIIYISTHHCNFNCPTCLGPRESGVNDSLISRFGVKRVVDAFRTLREQMNHKLYILLTGGEPTLLPHFADFVAQLTEFAEIGIQTNLCTLGVKKIAQKVQPKHVNGIEASFHFSIFDKNQKLEEEYFENFKLLMDSGFPIVCKIYAVPWELPPSLKFEKRLPRIREQLPKNTIIYVSHFIGYWKDKSYPHSYTAAQRNFLNAVMTVRKTEELNWIDGAWSFKNMICDTGHGMIFIRVDGELNRCSLDHASLGNLMENNFQLSPVPVSCQFSACSCPIMALWFGFQPWKYFLKGIPGDYNRFLANNINSPEKIIQFFLSEDRFAHLKNKSEDKFE